MKFLFLLLLMPSFISCMLSPKPKPVYDANKPLVTTSSKIQAAKNTFYGIDLQKMENALTREDSIECWRQLFSILLQQELKYIPQPSPSNDKYDYRMEEIPEKSRM